MIIASKTLAAIESAMAADDGASFRQWLGLVMPTMTDAYRGAEPPFRSHLGASVIGRECERSIFYGYRWFTRTKFPPRILRLFNRGHLEEARFIALLLMIGCEVYQTDEKGRQYRISDLGGHLRGSGDGFARRLPDYPDLTFGLEFKTHGSKSYAKLVKDGVQRSKPEHYSQMLTYLPRFGVDAFLYMGVNKDTDEIHAEIIWPDAAETNAGTAKAGRILTARRAPPRIPFASPGWHGCRFCDHVLTCFNPAHAEKNCRTCAFSYPASDGTWQCQTLQKALTYSEQLAGCGQWKLLEQ